MSRELIVRPEAEVEMAEAYHWYEACSPGLGADFLLSVEAVVRAAARNPLQFAVVHRGIRRGLTRRFPYQVFFLDDEQRVVVLAVLHAKRDPERWKDRT
ncbi:MAG: type II toxin-antitoxin system RelE/ParE family toxin [Spirochaetota bacterium]